MKPLQPSSFTCSGTGREMQAAPARAAGRKPGRPLAAKATGILPATNLFNHII